MREAGWSKSNPATRRGLALSSLITAWRRLGGIPFLCGVGLLACVIALGRLPSLRGAGVIPFLSYFLLASAAYVVAVLRLRRTAIPLLAIWALALAFRIALLWNPPSLSDDIYRYLWDGRLLAQGINPYAYPVDSPFLDAYATALRHLVNHAWMATPYLPAAQVIFVLLARFAPGSLAAHQVAAAAFDLGTGWLVMDLLSRMALPRRWVLLYLWNPLPVVEFAHAAHIDAWMIFLTVLAFWLAAGRGEVQPHPYRMTGSAVALAAATLTKGLPLLFLPLFLRPWGWRRLALYLGLVAGVLAFFAAGAGWGLVGPLDGSGVFGALRIYLSYWNYNGSIYHWLEVLLTGVHTQGAVPLTPETEPVIRLARLITTVLLGLVVCGAGLLAWRMDGLGDGSAPDHARRKLFRLRLAVLVSGAYLALAATVHPWYVTLILPFLPFLMPGEGEAPGWGSFVWPWLYLSCAVGMSYLTYIDPLHFAEYSVVRLVEYLPFYLLLALASGMRLLGKA